MKDPIQLDLHLRLHILSRLAICAGVIIIGIIIAFITSVVSTSRNEQRCVRHLEAAGAVVTIGNTFSWVPSFIRSRIGVFRRVVEVSFSGDDESKLKLDCLRHFSQLAKLELYSTRLDNKDLADIGAVSRLTTLVINDAVLLEPQDGSTLALRKVEMIDIGGTNAADCFIKRLTGLDNVTYVNLSRTQIGDGSLHRLSQQCELISELYLGDTQITDSGLEHVGSLDSMLSLSLGYTNVSDAGLSRLSKLKRLRLLDLTHTKISDHGLDYLLPLESLGTLMVANCEITDKGVETIGRFSKLVRLVLNDNDISDKGASHIRGLFALCALELGGTQLTDAGIKELCELPCLSDLDVSRTQVTDASLNYLASVKTLRSLNLADTIISGSAIDSFARDNKRCIVHR